MGCSNSRSTKVHSAIPIKSTAATEPAFIRLKKSFSEPDNRADKLLLTPKDDPGMKSVKLKIQKESSLKVRPPLQPKLPAFNVGAIVLSYVGYEDEVFSLLCLLNRNGRLYQFSHREYLRPFLNVYKKEITECLEFRADIVKGTRKSLEATVSIWIIT